ncbi:MAG: glycosyltransferase [Bacteroidales bacterium]|jgi:glycosyltransferase involved in cell wall biosynthesis|nr:glycosyltransferase [Bacteroidales bacterium]
MTKISVILTTYNGEKTVEKTIQSIISQEGNGIDHSIELIVIDDCSTDNTYSLIRQYNCIVLKNEVNSGGPNKGRNKGLSIATGDFICIADQDDIWKKDKIKTMLPYLNLAPIITSGYEVVNVKTNQTISRTQSSTKDYMLYRKNETFLKRLTKSSDGQNTYMGSMIYSSQLKDILFEEHFGMVDFDWLLRLFHQQTSIEVCKPLYERILDDTNLSLNETYRKYDFYYSLLTLEGYDKLYPKETALAYKKIHGSRARYYYLTGNMQKARFYFARSQWNIKTLFYVITSFVGSQFVKKHFNVFG